MSHPGSGAGASFLPCDMLVGVLGRVEAMRIVFDRLAAAGSFADMVKIPLRCNILDVKQPHGGSRLL